jgi:hypothetical protein
VTRVLASAALAALAGLAAFTNRALFLRHAGPAVLGWLALLGLACLVARWRAAAGQRGAVGLALLAFGAAAAGAIALSGEPGRSARHSAQFVALWLPLLALFHLRALAAARREILLLAASLGACLATLALAGPTLMRRVVLPRYALDVDHRPRPFLDGANEDGVYTSIAPGDVRDADVNVICLGDSFTANPHLPVADRWPTALETLLRQATGRRVRVFNFGWVSSSPLLQARRLRDVGARYKPDLVLQAVDMTDFHDDLRAQARLDAVGAGGGGEVSIFQALLAVSGLDDYGAWLRERLVWPKAPPEAIPRERFFAALRPLGDSEPLLATTWSAILETEALARGLGARFALFVLPRYQQYNPAEAPRDPERRSLPAEGAYLLEPFRFFERKAGNAGFPVRALREDFASAGVFPTCLENDPHWNAAGNRIAAGAIARHLLAEGLVGQPGTPAAR